MSVIYLLFVQYVGVKFFYEIILDWYNIIYYFLYFKLYRVCVCVCVYIYIYLYFLFLYKILRIKSEIDSFAARYAGICETSSFLTYLSNQKSRDQINLKLVYYE